DVQGYAVARPLAGDESLKLIDVRDLFPAHADDYISAPKAGPLRHRVRPEVLHQRPADVGEPEDFIIFDRHLVDAHTEDRSPPAPVADDVLGDLAGQVDRNGEPVALVGPAIRCDRGVHTNDF